MTRELQSEVLRLADCNGLDARYDPGEGAVMVRFYDDIEDEETTVPVRSYEEMLDLY